MSLLCGRLFDNSSMKTQATYVAPSRALPLITCAPRLPPPPSLRRVPFPLLAPTPHAGSGHFAGCCHFSYSSLYSNTGTPMPNLMVVRSSRQAASGIPGLLELGLPLPEETYQKPVEMKTVKGLRTRANTAAKDKTLINVKVGQHGITSTLLGSVMDVLTKHELVRVQLGSGCGLDRKEAAAQLEMLLDAVCIHQIGFTITLFRQRGLPRPTNCPSNMTSGSSRTSGGAAVGKGEGNSNQGIGGGQDGQRDEVEDGEEKEGGEEEGGGGKETPAQYAERKAAKKSRAVGSLEGSKGSDGVLDSTSSSSSSRTRTPVAMEGKQESEEEGEVAAIGESGGESGVAADSPVGGFSDSKSAQRRAQKAGSVEGESGHRTSEVGKFNKGPAGPGVTPVKRGPKNAKVLRPKPAKENLPPEFSVL